MSRAAGQVHTLPTVIDAGWPVRTRDISYVGDACVVHGSSDFDLADLQVVRSRFPGRHVTLDGDVITVWPRQGGRQRATATLPSGTPAFLHTAPKMASWTDTKEDAHPDSQSTTASPRDYMSTSCIESDRIRHELYE